MSDSNDPISHLDNVPTTASHYHAIHATGPAVNTNFANPYTDKAMTTATSSAPITPSHEPALAPRNSGLSTCPKCGRTFSRAADLDRYLGMHDPERRKYHCVVANGEYRGNYRKDKLASHVKNCHNGF